MKELLRTNDAVLLTYLEALLKDAGIDYDIFDRNMSIMEGTIGVLPRRVLVNDDQLDTARDLLTAAGIAYD